ncbi:hypothetical protein BAU15_09315 [Enterococcus sp. JM4C]|uniref:GIY-YIG nuclease family protein n=1 Tax=Candidatus Enterococcus huntleyi TaxID=1857217 RepID=UPI00137981F8|nr:GIY-YIG nuclease family protein [Enterococcus sp. JM4C]KAF1296834.1 hypothetical protein BAU15_09315 [Enterococcus sp. JM4C]
MLKEKARNLPRSPGVYLMKDYRDEVLYVGKAKRLKDRVSSYFHKNKQHSKKVSRMIHNIHDFEVIHVDTELDALLLECHLIQAYHPIYNRIMNHYKNYLYVSYQNQTFQLSQEPSADCYGPFKNYQRLPELLTIIEETYQLPTISPITQLILTAQLPEMQYLTIEEKNTEIHDMLAGKNQKILTYLRNRQAYCSQQMNFEYAKKLQIAIERMTSFLYLISQQRSTLTSQEFILSLPTTKEQMKHYRINYGSILETCLTPLDAIPVFSSETRIVENRPTFIEKAQIDPLYILASYIKRVTAGEIEGSVHSLNEERTDKN